MTKHLLGLFGRDAGPEGIVAAARETLERLGVEIPAPSDVAQPSEESSKDGRADDGR